MIIVIIIIITVYYYIKLCITYTNVRTFVHNFVNHYHVYENTGSKIHQTVANRRMRTVHII